MSNFATIMSKDRNLLNIIMASLHNLYNIRRFKTKKKNCLAKMKIVIK